MTAPIAASHSPTRWSRSPRADPRIVAVVNDSVGSSNLKEFKRRFPDRLVNVGIAEQNLVGVSAGLASAGKIPFTCGASCFLTGRALEQVKVDLAYSRHNVKLCGMSSGMAYGELGPTHHSIEDLAWTRAIANLTVIVPADPIETAQRRARRGGRLDGPVFLRLSRMPVPTVDADATTPFEIGRAVRLRDGTRCDDHRRRRHGRPRARGRRAARSRRHRARRVLNLSTIRPHRPRRHRRGGASAGPIVTVEEHTVLRRARQRRRGGRGRDAPGARCACSACRACSRRRFAEFLLEHFGLTPAGHSRRRARALRARRSDADGTPRHILAIDQGTTNTKALLFDERGACRRGAARPVPIAFPAAGLGGAGRRARSGAASRTAIDDCLAQRAGAAVDAVARHQPA